jgi:hypothetical protein
MGKIIDLSVKTIAKAIQKKIFLPSRRSTLFCNASMR